MAYELKTKPTDASVLEFLDKIAHPKRKEDAHRLLDLFNDLTNEEPKMWGSSIIGYGLYQYTYATGHSGEWMATGFSPRKQNLSLYLGGYDTFNKELIKGLGKYKTGKSCLYINKLEDVDMEVLKQLILNSYKNKLDGNGSC